MAVTPVYSGTLAPGANSGLQTFTVTLPMKGIAVSLSSTMSGTLPGQTPPVAVTYAVSIDGGVTYSRPIDLNIENNWSTTVDEAQRDILVGGYATHIQFLVMNVDRNSATVNLTAVSY